MLKWLLCDFIAVVNEFDTSSHTLCADRLSALHIILKPGKSPHPGLLIYLIKNYLEKALLEDILGC